MSIRQFQFVALKAQGHSSRGHRPRGIGKEFSALKGQSKNRWAFLGILERPYRAHIVNHLDPRALPSATMVQAFGLKNLCSICVSSVAK